jgi:uncharacterized damage-inducible protein DinB
MEAEVQGYLTEFNILRGDIGNAFRDLNNEGANWHPLPEGTNSIYAILTHMMGADKFWVYQVIGGKKISRDREAEFRASGNFNELLAAWDEHWAGIESALGKLSRTQLIEVRPVPNRPDQKPVTVQWIILHLISHYATHLGHIQLTRQLWDQTRREYDGNI